MFLAHNDSRYFIHLELIEKFSGSGMLEKYEKQTTLLFDDFNSLSH
jgi:hypothetical protein